MYSIHQLRLFLEVVRAGSVRAAAQQLAISQPSVSSALAGLQRDIGVPLFARDGRGLRLTPAGEAFARHARRISALMAHSVADARQIAAERTSRLVIGAVDTAAESFLGRLVAAFTAHAPDIGVELLALARDALGDQIEHWDVELGVAGLPPLGWPLARLAQRQNEFLIVAGEQCSASAATLSETLWFVREPHSGTREWTDEALRELGIDPPRRTIGSHAAIAHCVAAGLGVSLLSRELIAAELARGVFRSIPTAVTPVPRPWFLVAAENRTLSEEAQRFVHFALESGVFAPLDGTAAPARHKG